MGDEDAGRRPSDRRFRSSLLKSYYGVGDAENPSASDPSNIDSAAFDPDKFLASLLRGSSLSELMQKDSDMVSGMQNK